ncbi:thioredoxin family protein [Neisseriaceae bacterium B1]
MALVLGLTACAQSSNQAQVQELQTKVTEAQTTAPLAAQQTEQLEKTYTDMYFHLDSLTVESFKAKVARGETFYAYIGRPSCGDCQAFEPLFKRVIAAHGLNGKLYFVNVHFLQQDKVAWTAFKQQYGLMGTPTLAKYSKGKLVNKLGQEENGGMSIADVEKWLKLNGL